MAGVSRRSVLQGLGAAGLATGFGGLPTATAGTVSAPAARGDWAAIERQVRAEFRRQRLTGVAVAVVSSDAVLMRLMLGVRGTGLPQRRVTSDTHFLVGSTTKSMTALLLGTYVDDGTLEWDQPVVDAWSGFRAPTPELTRTLRVRDLLGMATGIGEPPALPAFHMGDYTAEQLLQLLATLPVTAPPETQWYYNNTVFAAGGYVPLLASGVKPPDVAAAYSIAMKERVYRPAGMTDSSIANDPRGLVGNYSRGHGLDVFGRTVTLPFVPPGSHAPAGSTLSTLDDMASYVRLQLRRGRSVTGKRVVSEANLAEGWKPHIDLPPDPVLNPDSVEAGYAMGWISMRYRDGRSVLWHNGAVEGFTSYIGFLPDDDLGLVVLNNVNPNPGGLFFYGYVLNLLLNQRFGLNEGVLPRWQAAWDDARSDLMAQGAMTRPVDRRRVERYLGHYEGGWRLLMHGHALVLRQQSRRVELRWRSGGSYIMVDGGIPGAPVLLRRDDDGTPTMNVAETGAVRRTARIEQ